VIILDTHIGVWWVHGDAHLPDHYRTYLEVQEGQGLGVSVVACWEVAKLVAYGRLTLPCPVAEWLDQASGYPGIRLLELTPRIMVESTQ
jgi:PIN domain nuclease of toxin-antitoxin system